MAPQEPALALDGVQEEQYWPLFVYKFRKYWRFSNEGLRSSRVFVSLVMRVRSLGSRGGGRGAFDGLGGYRSSHDDASDRGESEKLGRGRLGMVGLWG